jgi:hypothetical protein
MPTDSFGDEMRAKLEPAAVHADADGRLRGEVG